MEHVRPASPQQLEWLGQEARAWEDAGLLEPGRADAILAVYQPTRRFTIARLLLGLGAGFVGVGLVWLVAVNLDQLPPVARVVVVAAAFVSVLVTAEWLSVRRRVAVPDPVVASLRLLAALVWGATVLQAALSFDWTVDSWIAGVWALGALLHGYASRSAPPLLVGVGAGAFWWFAQLGPEDPTALALVVSAGAAATVFLALAALQQRPAPALAVPWREVGAGIALIMLFVAALPSPPQEPFTWDRWLVGGVVVAAAALAAALYWSRAAGRLEPAGAVATTLVAVVLVIWGEGAEADLPVAGDTWFRAGVSVAAYVALAGAVAALGALRDSARLTVMATIGLVVFTTVQAFEVFALIVEGAWLFVVLGTVLLVTGYLFDRARRRIAATVG